MSRLFLSFSFCVHREGGAFHDGGHLFSPSCPCTGTAIRRAHDVMDERGGLPLNVEVTAVAAAATVISHGIEVEVEFNPFEHPIEPLNNDHPIQCPLPEPSILNDGRIWNGRVSGNATRTGDLPMIPGADAVEPTSTPKRKPPPHPNGTILPSVSAPEHNLLKLLEECLPSVT